MSKELPNGQFMDLKEGYGSNYLTWGARRFASDSITTGFRYERCRSLIDEVAGSMDDYIGCTQSVE